MARLFFWSGIIGIALVVVSCATARSIKVRPGEGGEIAIHPSDNLEARQKAEVLMRQTCRGKEFKVVGEGEVVVGKTSSSSGNVDKKEGAYGGIRTSESTTETNLTEWRIEYKCVSK